jgi:6-phosphofructokinase 1
VALRFGATAVRFIAEGRRNVMVALRPPDMVAVPLAEAVEKMKSVPLDSDSILTARDMGISFGDD